MTQLEFNPCFLRLTAGNQILLSQTPKSLPLGFLPEIREPLTDPLTESEERTTYCRRSLDLGLLIKRRKRKELGVKEPQKSSDNKKKKKSEFFWESFQTGQGHSRNCEARGKSEYRKPSDIFSLTTFSILGFLSLSFRKIPWEKIQVVLAMLIGFVLWS